MTHKILVINTGSTSTKLSLFENNSEVVTKSYFHDADVIMPNYDVHDQVTFRKKVCDDFLKEYNIDPASIEVFAGRGGSAQTQTEGVTIIDRKLVDDTYANVSGTNHAAKYGVLVAWEYGKQFGLAKLYTLNPTNIDELCDEARITGIKGVYKKAQTHALNQKGIARKFASDHGKKYEETNLIVCHIDGGVTINAHQKGKMVDGTQGAGGDGPFSPTRIGAIPCLEVAHYMKNHSVEDIEKLCSSSGGFVSHFGTSDSDIIHKLVEQKDKKAVLIWNTMIYQICKEVGSMATVLKGQVDAIVLTGGLMRFKDIEDQIKERCSWIAPIYSYPGEVEQQTIADTVTEVVTGKVQAKTYTGEPVFKGFDFL